jgi:hypothetical protein
VTWEGDKKRADAFACAQMMAEMADIDPLAPLIFRIIFSPMGPQVFPTTGDRLVQKSLSYPNREAGYPLPDGVVDTMEMLQKSAPEVNLVKAFSCVGNAFMVNPQFAGGKPSMFICGNNEKAKGIVRGVLTQFGWETEDMGGVEAARAIEPLCMLWCIPGLKHDQWNHAFKLIRT